MSFGPSTFEIISTLCFALAIIHTFLVKQFQKLAHRYPEGSIGENFFHLLGEVEVVFGIWAGIFLFCSYFVSGGFLTLSYLNARDFTEPMFVFVIMSICSSKPILTLVDWILESVARVLPFSKSISLYLSAMTIGPLMGSFVTEPAAMTVTALFLLKHFFSRNLSKKFLYFTLGLLFVNISIGGTLTPYAAPPVLMVAGKWGWDLSYMLTHFGWKAVLAIILSNSAIVFLNLKEFRKIDPSFSQNTSHNSAQSSSKNSTGASMKIPLWVQCLHLVFLFLVVMSSHFSILFMGLFLFFLGLVQVTKEYQHEIRIKEALLVGFFLAGLVVLGGPQKWWLKPLIESLSSGVLYFSAAMLTAVTDNAALTYLGSLVEGLSEASKYSLVAGSVVGGGLTVIANAPNPAGYSILNASFGEEGISPLGLFKAALIPTFIACFCFWLL